MQVPKSFDPHTVQNIIKSVPWKLLDAVAVAAAFGALDYVANLKVDPTWAFLISYLVPQARKIVQEWYAGQPGNEPTTNTVNQ